MPFHRRAAKCSFRRTDSFVLREWCHVCHLFSSLSCTDYSSSHKDASNFWLNEGWTTYFERVLQHVIHGPAARDFSSIIGAKALTDALKEYENRPKYQRLVIDFDYGEVSKQLALISNTDLVQDPDGQQGQCLINHILIVLKMRIHRFLMRRERVFCSI